MALPTRSAPFNVPSLTGRRVRLAPVSPQLEGELYRDLFEPEMSVRWRLRGATPTPDSFRNSFAGDNVVALFGIEDVRTGLQSGVVGLYNLNLRARNAYVFALSSARGRTLGHAIHGVVLLLGYSFAIWDLNKVFFETSELSYDQFRSAVQRGYLTEEARLSQAEMYGDRFIDTLYLSCSRDRDWPKCRTLRDFVGCA